MREGNQMPSVPPEGTWAQLQSAVAMMTTNVAVLTEATRDLKDEMKRLREETVSREAHMSLVREVRAEKADREREDQRLEKEHEELEAVVAGKADQKAIDAFNGRIWWLVAIVIGAVVMQVLRYAGIAGA